MADFGGLQLNFLIFQSPAESARKRFSNGHSRTLAESAKLRRTMANCGGVHQKWKLAKVDDKLKYLKCDDFFWILVFNVPSN